LVGIDVAKEIHYARAFDFRRIELSKPLKVSNTAEGFSLLERWMQDICQQHDKKDIIVGFEPTGHYWFTLGDYLKSQGYRLAIVNPFHVKRTKELDCNSPSKSDRKDPKTIAMLVKDGRYREVYIREGLYQELREVVAERNRLVQRLKSINNQVSRCPDIHFPEFPTVFKDWRRQAGFFDIAALSDPREDRISQFSKD
jgi:transposase